MEIKLRFLTVYNDYGRDVFTGLQYWDQHDESWKYVKSIRCSTRELEEYNTDETLY